MKRKRIQNVRSRVIQRTLSLLLILAVALFVSDPISWAGNVDVNGDGVVNTADLEFVDARIGATGQNPADVNDDNVVNIVDLMLVKNAIGTRTTGPVGSVDGMVLIPAGDFQMGSNSGSSDERPVHTVYVDAFYMDKYEVTNAEYKKFVDANPQWQKGRIERRFHNGYYLHSWNGNNYPAGKGDHPVVYVSWYAAMAYSKWAGKRLPTEAEWEKAARGGLVGKVYPWGDTIDATRANYSRNVGSTAPVGSYPPNVYGLYDMVGNVWEWCLDEYQTGFYSNSPHQNPVAGGQPVNILLDNYTGVNTLRVLRGGSWYNYARYVRVASRFRNDPTYSNDGLGFRCARAVTP